MVAAYNHFSPFPSSFFPHSLYDILSHAVIYLGCRHLVEAAFQGQDSLPLLRTLQTSLLRRGSSLGSTTTARFGTPHAAADPSLQACYPSTMCPSILQPSPPPHCNAATLGLAQRGNECCDVKVYVVVVMLCRSLEAITARRRGVFCCYW